MSDSGHRRRFEAWLSAELRRAVATDVAGPERVMSLVRASSGYARQRRRRAAPATAFAFTVCVLGAFAFRMATLLMTATSTTSFTDGGAELRDTISAFSDRMEGTARLVGVAVIAPAAARMVVVHDFHGWDLHIGEVAQHDEHTVRGAAVSIAPGLRLAPVTRRATPSFDSVASSSTSDSMPERR